MKPTPERDGRGTPRPPLIEELKKIDLLKAGAEWYEASRLPDVPTLTAQEITLLWLWSQELSGAEIGRLMRISYQRVAYLQARMRRKFREASR